jgi:tRNA threonylcarbamoyladenosine biosynthesis protein TsaB
MANILLIDTALELASVCLCEDDKPVAAASNNEAREHAGWLQPAIAELMKRQGMRFADLDAVALSAGPGSYTGLRVAMASAKGLCYALSKPLIAINTLKIMAHAAARQFGRESWFCPMIDARRMEVFTAIYDAQLDEKMPPQALVLTEKGFDSWLEQMPVCFFGNGALKYKELLKSGRASFETIKVDVGDGASLAAEMYYRQAFADLAYAEPFYLKPFYSHLSVNS